jgi:hypothetical protein
VELLLGLRVMLWRTEVAWREVVARDIDRPTGVDTPKNFAFWACTGAALAPGLKGGTTALSVVATDLLLPLTGCGGGSLKLGMTTLSVVIMDLELPLGV